MTDLHDAVAGCFKHGNYLTKAIKGGEYSDSLRN